ncbi:hypothetical protein FNE59_14865 [Bacillus thuringiensis]|uniref:Uncharacterized protein n=1 Tax=Bacillus thuringiensis TaxID=1428 RepID=A0A9X7AJG8_BACTU|nr:hypothetical protein [Bacillus thuringiensis]PFT39711.1 hypothetical protein COK72_23170 [Bacillus thuringiensis]PQQ52681.1 hypothetical protein C6A34_01005 [Bacillus thuringiensis]
MIFPSFSPPFYKFRNIYQNTIKYTNFNYSKNEFCKNVPFKREFQKRQHPMGLRATRDRKNFLFFFGTRLGKECCSFLV